MWQREHLWQGSFPPPRSRSPLLPPLSGCSLFSFAVFFSNLAIRLFEVCFRHGRSRKHVAGSWGTGERAAAGHPFCTVWCVPAATSWKGAAHERCSFASSKSSKAAIRQQGACAAHVKRESAVRAEVCSPQTRKRADTFPPFSSFSFRRLLLLGAVTRVTRRC